MDKELFERLAEQVCLYFEDTCRGCPFDGFRKSVDATSCDSARKTHRKDAELILATWIGGVGFVEAMAMAESTFSDEESKKCCEAIDFAIKALKMEEVVVGTPLTLEQLREMDGKPVWIVESPYWGHWELSEDAEDYIIDRREEFYGLKHDDPEGKYGLHKLGWLAYAYPPAHIDLEALCGSWEGEADGYSDGELVYDIWKCTGCGHVEETDDPDWLPDFCPDCGLALTQKGRAVLEKRLKEVKM